MRIFLMTCTPRHECAHMHSMTVRVQQVLTQDDGISRTTRTICSMRKKDFLHRATHLHNEIYFISKAQILLSGKIFCPEISMEKKEKKSHHAGLIEAMKEINFHSIRLTSRPTLDAFLFYLGFVERRMSHL